MRSGKVMPPILVKGEWLMRSHHVSDLLLLELCYADTPWSELSPQPHIYKSGHIFDTLGCKTPQVLSSQLCTGLSGSFFLSSLHSAFSRFCRMQMLSRS